VSKAKYKTLRELANAYASGELPKKQKLVIDSWRCYIYSDDDNAEPIFRQETSQLLEEALRILGVPFKGA
jgi:hypothetical protein